jgi:hypothetical protein
MRIFLLIIYISSLIIAIEIKPKLDLVLRYNTNDEKYTNIGQMLKGVEKVKFDASVVGGDFGVDISYDNFNFVIQGSSVVDLKNEDDPLKIDTTYFDNDQKEFSYLSNLYISYQNKLSSIRVGRQQYNNNLVNKNKKIISNQYQGIYFDYTKDNYKTNVFYFTKIASSTVANVVPFNHHYGAIGYGMGYNVGNFTDISKHITNVDHNTKGAIVFDGEYSHQGTKINVQNLYVDNFFNTFYLEAKNSYKVKQTKVSARVSVIFQKDIGENHFAKKYNNKKINGKMYQGSLNFDYHNLFGSYTYSKTFTDKDAVLNGTIISPFSNKLGWIKGPQTAHAFVANTISRQYLIGTSLTIYKLPIVIVIASNKYNIKDNFINHTDILTKEDFIHTKLYLSKNLNFVLQYSQGKNLDLQVTKNTNTRAFFSYTY